LSPVLHLMRWGSPKQIAATSAAFILFNSLSAIAARAAVHGIQLEINHVWLALAVVAGSIIGAHSTIKFLSEKMVRYFTIAIITLAALRILYQYTCL
jgi:uncharacterized protein